MNSKNPQGGQKVNKIGKFIYNHIDGAYKITFTPNTCDVYMLMYYQHTGEEIQEMRFNISMTTYANKIRINTTEISDLEKTIGQDIYKPEQLEVLDDKTFNMIYEKIRRHIDKEYSEYDFVY